MAEDDVHAERAAMKTELEGRALEKLAADYRERGYEVQIRPQGPMLPGFLQGYQPDLIARSPTDSVVIEVKSGTRVSVAERFREIAERVNRQPGWRFALLYVNPERPEEVSEAPLASLLELEQRARTAETLLQTGQPDAAFVLLWTAIEGALRLIGRRTGLPVEQLPPSTLLRELYSAGEISREQYEPLLRLLPARNQVMHGFGTNKDVLQIEQLRLLAQSLFDEARTT